MEGSQAASWDGTISHNLFHPFLPPKRCWTNIQNSDFIRNISAILQKYTDYIRFLQIEILGVMDFVSQTDLLFSLHNLPSYFHHSTPPVARTLGAFFGLVVPPTKLMEPQVLMQHLCRGHFLLDFFFVLFLGCQVGIKYLKAKQFEGPTVNQVLKLMACQIRCQ